MEFLLDVIRETVYEQVFRELGRQRLSIQFGPQYLEVGA